MKTMLFKNSYIQTLFHYFIGLFLFLLSYSAYAIVIGPNTIITSPTTYSNTTLDMSHGNFIVQNSALLTIENCTITGTVSPTNPYLFSVALGSLNLINNHISITATDIVQDPRIEASYYAIRVGRAAGTFTGNSFIVDKQLKLGLFTSNAILPVRDFTFTNNTFQNFHGVIYLLNSSNTIIDNNVLRLNSSGNIVIVGNKSKITNNTIYFPGLNEVGDGIDLVGAEDVTITRNNIFTPTSMGIAIVLSRNVTLDSNIVTGGITYGIEIYSNSDLKNPNNFASKILARLNKKLLPTATTENITITNNALGLNRYGIYATDVNNLTIINNYFTQRFDNDAAARKFWTDNNILLVNVTNLTWTNNIYKEAFTQVNGGDNSMTQFVPFPASGGVVL
jgi:parallel beta-helix repeat protein